MIKLANKEVKLQTVEVPVTAPPINAGTIARLILFVIAIINTVAVAFGYDVNIQVDGDMLYEGVSLVLDLIIFGVGFWKNNNVTKSARVKAEAAKQVVKK